MISTTRRTGHCKPSYLLRHVGLAVLAAVAPISANAGWLTFEVPLDLPDPASIGGYQGDVSFTLGRVRDEVFAESPEFLGTFETGYKGLHVVVGEMSREEAVTRTVQHVLQGTGLLKGATDHNITKSQ
jgi:hypothetical protein